MSSIEEASSILFSFNEELGRLWPVGKSTKYRLQLNNIASLTTGFSSSSAPRALRLFIVGVTRAVASIVGACKVLEASLDNTGRILMAILVGVSRAVAGIVDGGGTLAAILVTCIHVVGRVLKLKVVFWAPISGVWTLGPVTSILVVGRTFEATLDPAGSLVDFCPANCNPAIVEASLANQPSSTTVLINLRQLPGLGLHS